MNISTYYHYYYYATICLTGLKLLFRSYDWGVYPFRHVVHRFWNTTRYSQAMRRLFCDDPCMLYYSTSYCYSVVYYDYWYVCYYILYYSILYYSMAYYIIVLYYTLYALCWNVNVLTRKLSQPGAGCQTYV